jgi:hypothetical protein
MDTGLMNKNQQKIRIPNNDIETDFEKNKLYDFEEFELIVEISDKYEREYVDEHGIIIQLILNIRSNRAITVN